MFSVRQKREIADKIQKAIRETNHPELPISEIEFHIHIDGINDWSYADILNNGAVRCPDVNPWNETQDVVVSESGVKSEQDRVADFHHLINNQVGGRLAYCADGELSKKLLVLSERLLADSENMLFIFKETGDQRALRMHLILGELSELMEAKANRDEIETFDALIDLMYVTLGTGVAFDLPLHLGFDDVHRSNMTKQVQSQDPDKERCRDKGPNYVPPNLQAVLADYRGDRD